MSEINTIQNNLESVAAHIGIALMASAAVLTVAELGHHGKHGAAHRELAYVYAGANEEATRREKTQEAGRHEVSYGVSMRTPSRAGKA